MEKMNTLVSARVRVPVREGRASRVSPARPKSEGRRGPDREVECEGCVRDRQPRMRDRRERQRDVSALIGGFGFLLSFAQDQGGARREYLRSGEGQRGKGTGGV